MRSNEEFWNFWFQQGIHERWSDLPVVISFIFFGLDWSGSVQSRWIYSPLQNLFYANRIIFRHFGHLFYLSKPNIVGFIWFQSIKSDWNLFGQWMCTPWHHSVQWLDQQAPRMLEMSMFIHTLQMGSPIFHEIKSLIWLNWHFYGWDKWQSSFRFENTLVQCHHEAILWRNIIWAQH